MCGYIRLFELHRTVFVASGVSHNEKNQTAMSYCSQFRTKKKQIQVWQLLYMSGNYEWMPDDDVQVACPSNIGDMCIPSKMTV